jgi:hypothetical protein
MIQKIKKEEVLVTSLDDFVAKFFPNDRKKLKGGQPREAYDFGAELAIKAIQKHKHLLSA